MNGGTSGGSGSGPCGACKFLRRKCVNACIFAPYFDSEQGAAHFAVVHKVFGASNVSKLLLHLPAHKRLDAVVTVCYEAQARLRDPVYGCVAHIFALQQQVVNLQAEVAYMHAHLSELSNQVPQPQLAAPAFGDVSTASNPAALDLPTFFDAVAFNQTHPFQQAEVTCRMGRISSSEQAGGGGELHALARELLSRRLSSAAPTMGSIAKALSN